MGGIAFNSVSKAYGSVAALRDLSFAMPAGALSGFVGPNGAGKSTSFRAMLGLTPTDAGTITVLDRPVATDIGPIVKRVGALLEHPGHLGALTGRANLRVVAATLGNGTDFIDSALEMVDLTADADRKVNGYSKGMRQRLGLAAALLGDPDLLILDEPLDGLDPAGQVAFKAQLRNLVDERGKTVVVSSHDLKDVEQLADHIVMIDKGALVMQGSMSELVGSRSQLRVRIGDTAAAERVLTGAGFEVRSDRGELIVDADDGATINALLSANGLHLSALIPEVETLESTFLKLTGPS